MRGKMISPIPNTYWVEPGSLLAGPHPLAGRMFGGRGQLESLVSLGVVAFIDLTWPGELGIQDYRDRLESIATGQGREAAYYRHPIIDMRVPAPAEMRQVLDRLEGLLGLGRRVYIHCLAGQGRTGTVVGCYLVTRGFAGESALQRIQRLRSVPVRLPGRSPENERQREFVRKWTQLDPGPTA
jgi:hypothetical protein